MGQRWAALTSSMADRPVDRGRLAERPRGRSACRPHQIVSAIGRCAARSWLACRPFPADRDGAWPDICSLFGSGTCRAGQGMMAIDPGEPMYLYAEKCQTLIGLPEVLVARSIGVTAFPSAT